MGCYTGPYRVVPAADKSGSRFERSKATRCRCPDIRAARKDPYQMHSSTTSAAGARQAGYLPVLIVLFGAEFLAGFNENLMNMALMSIMGEYGIGPVTAQWLVTGYMIVATVVVMCMAFLFRRFPVRTLFFAGAALTIAGSLMGLLAPNFVLLMAARLVQAAGSGVFIPLAINTILALMPKNRLGTYMSISGCMITFGPAFAPVVCGMLVTALGWHSIFAVPLLVMAVLTVLGAVFLRNLETSHAQLDVASVVLSAVFLFTLSFGLAQVSSNILVGVVSLALCVASAVVFVVRQGRVEHPLIDMTPMKSIQFWPAVLLVIVCMMTTFSLSVLLPLYFEGALGMSAFMAGLVILIPVLANAGCTLVGGRMLDARGEWPLLPLGLGLIAVGTLLMVFAAPALSAPAMFVAALLAYAGVGLGFSPSQTAGLRTLPPQMNPFGVALMTTFVQVAACIGPALFTGIMASSQAVQLTAGADGAFAAAQGFSSAILVASLIGFAGTAIALVYALAARKRALGAAERGAEAAASAHAGPAATAATTPAPQTIAAASLASIMEADPYTVPAGAPVRDAMRMLVERHVSGMPLVDADGCLAGFVSDGDIMRYLADKHPVVTTSYALIEAANNQTIDERLHELMELPVSHIATAKVVTLRADASLKEACQVLSQHKLKKVPVVEDGRVVGTVNRSDVLRFAMEAYLAREDGQASA